MGARSLSLNELGGVETTLDAGVAVIVMVGAGAAGVDGDGVAGFLTMIDLRLTPLDTEGCGCVQLANSVCRKQSSRTFFEAIFDEGPAQRKDWHVGCLSFRHLIA